MAIAALSFVYTTPVAAYTDPIADIFDSIFDQPQYEAHVRYKHRSRHYYRQPIEATGGVSAMIADHVSARIGSEWVPTALKIARIESGGRCGVVNRIGATGIFQVMHPERFGVSRAAARTCSGGIAAGVAHMEACIAKGAHTSSQMMRCHNSGNPWGRVERAYRRFV